MNEIENTGDFNTGNRNTGDRNTGDENTGNRNTGDENTGSWNTGGRNTGYFNTLTPKNILVFNKECSIEEWELCVKPDWIYFDLLLDVVEWVNIEDMSEQQKIENPTFHLTCGFLLIKKSKYNNSIQLFKESAKKSWNGTSHEDKMLTYNLPNFNPDIAEEIFGIDFNQYLKETVNIKIIDGKKYKLIEE